MQCFIVHEASDFESFEPHYRPGIDALFAWTTEAVIFLRNKKLPYLTLSDISKKEEEVKIDKEYEKLKGLYSWCHDADKIIHQKIPKFEKEQIWPFTARLHSLRFPFYRAINELNKLKIVRDHFEEKVYYTFDSKKEVNAFYTLCSLFKEKLCLEEIIKSKPQKHQLDLTFPYWYYPRSFVKNFFRFILRDRKWKSYTSFFSSFLSFPFSRKKWVLVFSHSFGKQKILKALKEKNKNLEFFYWQDVPFLKKGSLSVDKNELLKDLMTKLDGHPWTLKEGVNFLPLFEPLIKKVIFEDLEKMSGLAKTFKALNKKFKFKLMFTTDSLTETDLMFYLADREGIQSVLALHGGTVGLLDGLSPSPVCTRNLKNKENSHYLIYSELVKDFVDETKEIFPTYSANNVVTGSAYFEDLM